MDLATNSRRSSIASHDDEARLVSSLLLDPRSARVADRAAPLADPSDEGKEAATVEIASIMTTTSNPVSPGPSSPVLLDPPHRPQHFVPPARPSSTPFPQPEPRNAEIICANYPVDNGEMGEDWDPSFCSDTEPFVASEGPRAVTLSDFPIEIHQAIADHLLGELAPPIPRSSADPESVARNWGTMFRHSRRREVSQLATLNRAWRVLVQQRLFRHVKIKGTIASINESIEFFAHHPHLRPYVRHLEIWFPVFQPKLQGSPGPQSTSMLPMVTADAPSATSYVRPTGNCSLEEALYFASTSLPRVNILTLEGGERKNAPKVKHFINPATTTGEMPTIPTVETLITRGQWNLIRSVDDFLDIVSALPNLKEWQGFHSKPKSKSYLTVAEILPRLPPTLTTLNLVLEPDYRREVSFPPYFIKVSNRIDFCAVLGSVVAPLEHISYTGRVCFSFFNSLARAAIAADPAVSRLKSIDLTVKNICRKVAHWNESGSGIMDMNFINAWEFLILAAIRALAHLPELKYVRIRYVDLESPIPALNPYFLLHADGTIEGVWSHNIVRTLQRCRPDLAFRELDDSPGAITGKDARMGKVTSFKLSNYMYLGGPGYAAA